MNETPDQAMTSAPNCIIVFQSQPRALPAYHGQKLKLAVEVPELVLTTAFSRRAFCRVTYTGRLTYSKATYR